MLALFVLAAFVAAQQVYIHGEGLSPLPSCSGHGVLSPPTPSYQSKGFRYSLTETTRTALSVTVASTGSFALPYSAASHLLANVSTTSWGNWSPNATKPTDVSDPYGQAAWSALWDQAAPQNWTTGVYSTTASPTPVPTSSLILPPPRYFQPSDNCYTFHEDFILGVAGAAAQIEGAVAHEGRSPAFPDIVPAIIPVQQSIVTESLPYYGVAYDYVANEGYYLYKRDIDRLAAVGVKYYSFSIAWSRILPFGLPSTPVNSEAIAHYDDVIAYVVSKGMLPLITLHHYDTPLQFYGSNYTNSVQDTKLYMANWDLGLQNDTFQDAFVNYGKIVMTHFANRVPVWFSINEPQAGATGGAAVHNVIRAHARLAHFYREELNGTGKFSMKMGSASGVPEVPTNASHLAAVQHYDDLQLGTFLKPLVLGRDYPEAFKMTLQDYAPLTAQDLAYMAGTMANTLYPNCVTSSFATRFGWEAGPYTSYVGLSTPTYMREGLSYLWDTYGVAIMISEFGTTDYHDLADEPLPAPYFDQWRSDYYVSYLNEILKAIWEDGMHVMGTLAWSFADNWEWGTYNHKLGMQAVDRTTQERTYKRSMFDYVDFYQSRGGKR